MRKIRNKKCYCKYCNKIFLAADIKAAKCYRCSKQTNLCRCGCGGKTKGLHRKYILGHAMYDDKNKAVKLGHRKQGLKIRGYNNPAKKMTTRKKISAALMGRCVWQENKTPQEIKETMQKIANGRSNKYALAYTDEVGNTFRSYFEIRIANLLKVFCIPYHYEKVLALKHHHHVVPDFTLVGPNEEVRCLIEVTGSAFEQWREQFIRKVKRIRNSYPELPIVVVTYAKVAPYMEELSSLPFVRIFSMGEAVESKIKTKSLIIESDHFNFDYSHFLPWHKGACADFHGHSSKISVMVTGLTDKKGMVLDFSILKKVIRKVIKQVDHKIFVPGYCLKGVTKGIAKIRFVSKNRYHKLDLPATEIFKLDSDSTIENIAEFLCKSILNAMPWNVLSVRIKVNEGVGKSAAYGIERDNRAPSSITEDPNQFLRSLHFYRTVPMKVNLQKDSN